MTDDDPNLDSFLIQCPVYVIRDFGWFRRRVGSADTPILVVFTDQDLANRELKVTPTVVVGPFPALLQIPTLPDLLSFLTLCGTVTTRVAFDPPPTGPFRHFDIHKVCDLMEAHIITKLGEEE